MGKLGWEWCRGSGCEWTWGRNSSAMQCTEMTRSCYLGRCLQASSCPVWLHLWVLTEEGVPAPHLLVLSTERSCVGRSFKIDSNLTAILSWGKKGSVLHNCQSRGNNSSLTDIILSSLDEHKPCPGDIKGVCLMCICQLRAQSGEAVSRKVSTRDSFFFGLPRVTEWTSVRTQANREKSIVPKAQSPTPCGNWCWVLERWQENIGKALTVLCNVRSSFFLFS